MNVKTADELVNGDVIIETELVKKKARVFKYKVTGVKVAACSPHKTHVIIDGARQWCYDSKCQVAVK